MLASILAGLATTWAIIEALARHEGALHGTYMVARMTSKMRTVCVGRILIDMPEEARIEFSGARIDGFSTAAFSETNDAFQGRLARREAQLRAGPDRPGGRRNLEVEDRIGSTSGMAGKMFVHSRTVTEGTATHGLGLERYRYESVAVEALVHVKGLSVDLAADDYYPDRVSNLTRLVEKLVPVAKGEPPSEPGFCIGGASFDMPPAADQNEEIIMAARLPSHPDIEFLLVLAMGMKPPEHGLLERGSASKERIPFAARWRFTELRAAAREINELSGEELVTRVQEENGAKVNGFWWEVAGSRHNASIPQLMFKMDTGRGNRGPVPSSLPEEAALQLWDRIVSSIRMRTMLHSNPHAVNATVRKPSAAPVPE